MIEYFKKNLCKHPIFIFSLGCLSALSFSSNSIFICVPLMFIALSSLFFFLYQNTFNKFYIFFVGSLFSFGQLFFGLYWIANSFEYIFANGIYIGIIAVIFLTIALSTFYGLSCIIIVRIKYFLKLNLLGFALIFSIFLSLAEYLRGNLLGGFPWNIIGYIWIDSSSIMQSVSLIGIYGLGLFTFLAATSIILAFKNIKYAVYSLLPVLLLFIYGETRLTTVDNNTNKFLNIRVVQPAISQNEKWNEKLKSKHLEKLITLSVKDNISFIPNIILWPESAFPYNSTVADKNKEIFDWLGEDQILITGITRAKFNDSKLSNIYNSALITDKDFFTKKYYDKVRLVPFGEYNPFKKIFKFEKFTDGALDFTPGTDTNIFKLSNVNYNIAVLICYEVIFPSKIINGVRPDLIVNLTNDAWYGDTYGPLQHIATARVRAIEEGLPLVRVANTGISAVINKYGKYIKRLELGEEGVIDTSIPLSKSETIFSKLGNYMYIISLIFMLMLIRFPFISTNSTKWRNK